MKNWKLKHFAVQPAAVKVNNSSDVVFYDNSSERDELAKFKWNLYPASLRSFF